MVEQVVAALSSFRQAARDANDNVRQLLGGLMPSVSRANESSKELSDTARASSQSDNDTKVATSKAAGVAEETASLGEQILNELKEFSKKFTTLINAEGGSFVDNILGIGAGVGMGAMALSSAFDQDLSFDSSEDGQSGNRPAEGFSGNLAKITTASGKTTWVAEEHAARFQGFINDLEATGYKIKDLGGYNYRQNVNDPKYLSYHGLGAAIDINPAQNPNGTSKTDMPRETADLARKWGLGWGMSFQDPMHFSAARFEGGYANIPRQEYVENSPFKVTYKESGSVSTASSAPQTPGAAESSADESGSTGTATSSSEPPVNAAPEEPPTPSSSNGSTSSTTTAQPSYARPEIPTADTRGAGSDRTTTATVAGAQPTSSNIPTTSLAMSGAAVETANFEPAKLEVAAMDITPTSSYTTASLSGTGSTSRPVVTPAVNYPAPQDRTGTPSAAPPNRSAKPLDVNFDTGWIAVANGNKKETNGTWVA